MDIKEKANSFLAKLPFTGMAEKIPAGARAKVPVLEKAIPFANHIACALVLGIVVTLIACGGGKSVEQLTKESQKLAEQMEGLDPGNPDDAAKLFKLAGQAAKLAAELEKAETKAAGKPAKASKGSGKARPASEFQYDLTADGQGILIKGFTGAGGKVVVPEKIEDMPVVAIGDDVFNGKTTMTKLDFSQTKEANDKAGITAIILPNTVKKIGTKAFANTAITTFIMPDSVTELGTGIFNEKSDLFEGCEALTEVHLSDSLELLPWGVGAKNLKKINLPKSLKGIADFAFNGCSELSDLIIPASLTSVEFGDIDGGKWIEQSKNHPTYGKPVDAANVFAGCGKLPIKTRQTIQDWGYKGKF